MRRRILAWVLVCLLPLTGTAVAKEVGSRPRTGLTARFILIPVLRMYQYVMAPFMIHRCPSYPHCSEYAVQAIQKHGALLGWFMAVDRLYHEAGELDRTESTFFLESRRLVYDPVKYNDFWWNETMGHTSPAEAKIIAKSLLP